MCKTSARTALSIRRWGTWTRSPSRCWTTIPRGTKRAFTSTASCAGASPAAAFSPRRWPSWGCRWTAPGDAPAAKRALRTHLAVEAAFLRGLPALIETEKYIFVHGGLPTPDVSRITAADLPGLLKFDAFLENAPRFDKTVFVGHWPVVLYDGAVCCANPIFDRERHIVSLDGGCGVKHGAQLNAVLVGPDGAFSCAYCDGLPQVRALDAQARGADPFHLRWTERAVERLSAENGVARVRHSASGRILDVPESYLYADGGRLCCADFPADRLEIAPGDLLSLVDETPLGYIVKKDGVSGLYGGRIRAL